MNRKELPGPLIRKEPHSATVKKADTTTFREFVAILQNDVNMRYASDDPVNLVAGDEDPEVSGQAGVNYHTEPAWFRMGYAPETPLTPNADNAAAPHLMWTLTSQHFYQRSPAWCAPIRKRRSSGRPPDKPSDCAWCSLWVIRATTSSNCTVTCGRKSLTPLRWRSLEQPIAVEPFWVHLSLGSTIIADQPTSTSDFVNNRFSNWEGSQMGVGPSSHFDIVPSGGAGGTFKIAGDYLYRTHQDSQFDKGVWGLLRVRHRSSSRE